MHRDVKKPGLMSDAPLIDVNRNLEDAKVRAFELGVSKLIDPFMTLLSGEPACWLLS